MGILIFLFGTEQMHQKQNLYVMYEERKRFGWGGG